MKAFTDIEQSKYLAEILPIESADMWWDYYYSVISETGEYGKEPMLHKPVVNPKKAVPCWSLAALLNILPTVDNKNPVFCKDIRYDQWYILYPGNATLESIHLHRHNNLIDACYELVTYLYEQKLL